MTKSTNTFSRVASLMEIFFLLLLPFFLFGQNSFSISAGARGIGMSNANLTFQDIHSIFNNQSGLAYLDGFSATAFVENRFLLDELQLVSLGVAIPTTTGTFGVLLQHFGFQDFNEQKIGINYSRKLFNNLAIGAQFDVLHTRISEYGSKFAVTFEVGLQYKIVKNITAGIHVFNPIRASITDEDPVPSIIQIGLTYQPSDYLMISSSIEKDTELPYNFRMGLEYFLFDKIYFRAGINSNPHRFSFGLGYVWNRLQLNVAASYHDVLGFSPSFGFSFLPG